MLSSALASVSVAVLPETATGLVSARSTAVPPTLTVNAPAAGTDAVSSPPSKASFSAAPFTDADENAGGVALVAVLLLNAGASLPDRSFSRFAVSAAWKYHTCTLCPCDAARAASKVAVTVRPEIETLNAASISIRFPSSAL